MSTLSSTHCPLTFSIKGAIQSDTQPDQRGYKISWDETKCETYRDNLVSEQSALKLQQIHDMLNSETVHINNIVATLTNVIREAAQPLTRIYSTSRPNRQPERPMWWTAECHARKSEHNRAWRRCKQLPTEENYGLYQQARRTLILTHGVITSVITVETVLNNYARYKLRTPNNFGKRFRVRIKAHMYCLI